MTVECWSLKLILPLLLLFIPLFPQGDLAEAPEVLAAGISENLTLLWRIFCHQQGQLTFADQTFFRGFFGKFYIGGFSSNNLSLTECNNVFNSDRCRTVCHRQIVKFNGQKSFFCLFLFILRGLRCQIFLNLKTLFWQVQFYYFSTKSIRFVEGRVRIQIFKLRQFSPAFRKLHLQALSLCPSHFQTFYIKLKI